MDFATILAPDLAFDWAVADGALLEDEGLFTAVALSLFTDRLANPDDTLPDGGDDRRGWWGDAYLPVLADGSPDRLGSRLWLLARAQQLPETAQRAQAYCREALEWLIDDGVAASVGVPLPVFPQRGLMAITVVISQIAGNSGAAIDRRYEFLWDATHNAVAEAGIAIGGF